MENERVSREQETNSWDFHSITVASNKVLPSLEVGVRHSHIVTPRGIQMISKGSGLSWEL